VVLVGSVFLVVVVVSGAFVVGMVSKKKNQIF
jgi:hypothetical protein